MVTTVSFPGLGLEFELNRVAFSIGGFNVYWYGLLIGIGFMLAGTYALLNARKVGVDSDRLIDVVMVGLVCGVIGARLYYVIFDWETFQGDLSKIFDIRQGGLAIYGGILAGMAGGIIMAKIRKVRVRPAMDLAAAFLYQALGKAEREGVKQDNFDFSDTGAEDGMVRLFINIGKKQRVRPGDILGAVAGESGMPGDLVGAIDMFDSYTFVEVPREYGAAVLKAMKNAKIKGKSINVEPANAK